MNSPINRRLVGDDINKYEKLSISEMLDRAGNSDTYQFRMLLVSFLTFFFAAFIQMGFPIIFQPAVF